MATSLFDDDSLQTKHRSYLDKLQWDKHLKQEGKFIPAKECLQNKGFVGPCGKPKAMPHNFYVYYGIYFKVYDVSRV